MARHRNVRSMNYSDECDGYDDVYGHSVEDDYSVSPSVQSFMYDRNKPSELSTFLPEENNIAEEDENVLEEEVVPHLSDLDQARLNSCVEEVQNVIGDAVPLKVIQNAVCQFNFDVKKSLDAVLNLQETSLSRVKVAVEVSTNSPLAEDPNKQDFQIPSLSLATPGKVLAKGLNVTKGFEVSGGSGASSRNQSRCASPAGVRLEPKPSSRNHSRCTSPASGRCSPDPDKTPSKPTKSKIDVEASYAAERGSGKAQLHMVVIGHVDAGKSTLMGHLLLDLGQVNQRTMHKYEQECKKIGKQSFLYAWILDETDEERARGVTMDVGQRRFETNSKIIYLLDAPGHRDFIPNMISGAAQADVALLVVDATKGEFETGFESGGQTREHALLVKALGVNQLAVVVNKLDTVDWSKERFDEIVGKLKPFLKQAMFKENDVKFVPCSGMSGENVVNAASQSQLTSWYQGPTLFQVIDSFTPPERPISKPLRITISDIYKGTGSGQCLAGRVETGMLQTADKVLIMPLNEQAQVKGIQIDEMPVQFAYAGDGVSVILPIADPASLTIGSVLSDLSSPVPVVTIFEARIIVFNILVPITPGYPVVLHAHAVSEQATVDGILSLLNRSSGEVVKKNPRRLIKNSTAVIRIKTARPICLEMYQNIRELGRVMLRVNGVTIAAGVVTKLL